MDAEFPVRCVCGKAIFSLHRKYLSLRADGLSVEDSLDKLGVAKMCCRTRFRCHVPNLGGGYPRDPQVIDKDGGSGDLTPVNVSEIGRDSVYD